jgi:hypothetical protein
VTLNAIPKDGCRFLSWSVTGVSIPNPTAPTINFTIPAKTNVQVKANFEKIPIYKATFSVAAGGSVTDYSLGSIKNGASVLLSEFESTSFYLSATAQEGYRFTGWTVTGVNGVNTNYPILSFTVPPATNVKVQANFEIIGADIKVSAQGLGTFINFSGARVGLGKTVTVLAMPIPFISSFDHWEINGVASGTNPLLSYKVTSETTLNIKAVFK